MTPPMITREQLVPLLLAACPSFRATWDLYATEATFDESLHYVHAGAFAQHLVALVKSGNTLELPAVFELVERLHVEGDAYIQELATIGLLEAIQNNADESDTAVFMRHLGPSTRHAWDDLTAFWEGRQKSN